MESRTLSHLGRRHRPADRAIRSRLAGIAPAPGAVVSLLSGLAEPGAALHARAPGSGLPSRIAARGTKAEECPHNSRTRPGFPTPAGDRSGSGRHAARSRERARRGLLSMNPSVVTEGRAERFATFFRRGQARKPVDHSHAGASLSSSEARSLP